MDRFFDQQNIERYRQLANASTRECERKLVLALLAAEEAEFKRDESSQGTNCGIRKAEKMSCKITANGAA
jgi:hypothetical protein